MLNTLTRIHKLHNSSLNNNNNLVIYVYLQRALQGIIIINLFVCAEKGHWDFRL